MKEKTPALQSRALPIVLLCILLVMAGTANAQSQRISLDFDEPIEAIAAHDDTFVVLSGGALFTYHPDETAPSSPTPLTTAIYVEQILLNNDNAILALAATDTTYDIYEASIDQETLSLAYQIPRSDAPAGYLRRALWQNGQIILEYQNDALHNANVLIYDTHCQKSVVHYDCGLANLMPYRDGKLLGLRRQSAGDRNDSIVTYDVTTKEISDWMPVSKIPETYCYDVRSQSVITFISPYANCLSPSNDLRKQIYVPVSFDAFDGRCCAINSTHLLALSDDTRLHIVSLDAAGETDGLRITRFNPEGPETKRFRQAHPEIPVLSTNMDYQLTPAMVGQSIRAHDTETDVYMLRTFETGYADLLKKGFCSSLTGHEGILANVQKMPPNLSSALFDGNELLAVPVEMEFDAWTALVFSNAILDETGISAEDIPSNMLELLDRLILWYEDGTLAGMRLLDSAASDQSFVITWFIINNYTDTILANSGTLDYDTALFNQLMEKCDLLCSTIRQHTEITDSSPFLFTPASPAYLLTNENRLDSIFVPVVPSAGMKECYPAYLTVAVQNPLSQNKELGQFYLASILNDLPVQTRLLLWPELARPQEREGYQEEHQFAASEVERLQALLNEGAVEESQRAECQARLEETKQWLDDLEKKERWDLSPEAIESYRQLVDDVYIPSSYVREVLDEPMLDTIRQYAYQQISLRALIDAIVHKTRFMRME